MVVEGTFDTAHNKPLAILRPLWTASIEYRVQATPVSKPNPTQFAELSTESTDTRMVNYVVDAGLVFIRFMLWNRWPVLIYRKPC